MTVTDINPAAVETIRTNAERLGLADTLTVLGTEQQCDELHAMNGEAAR